METRIDAEDASPGAAAVRLSEGESTLFLVHDGAGAVEYARALAGDLGPPVSAVALPGIAPDEPGLRTIEGMAARLVRMIRSAQPAGPYRIAGWGVGGLLAFEAATLLLGQDEAVDLVGVLDPGENADAEGAYGEAARRYVPHPLPIPVHVFAPGDPAAVQRGWQARLPGTAIRAIPVPGTDGSGSGGLDAPALVAALAREAGRAERPGEAPRVEPHSPLVPLQLSRAGTATLFCFPGAGAGVSGFSDLSRSLDPSWRVYGLEPRGLDGERVPHTTVEAAAELHLDTIRRTEPTGPVHLLGHSFGGWVAFEVARRLREAGRPVVSLTLLDTSAPDDQARAGEHHADDVLLALVEVMEMSAERSFDIRPETVASLDHPARLRLLHDRLVRFGQLSPRSTPEMLAGPFRVFGACLRTTYRPESVYPEPARLVLVSDTRLDEPANQRSFVDTVRGWRRWMPGLRFSRGAGNHMTALKRPHVQHLAALLTSGG